MKLYILIFSILLSFSVSAQNNGNSCEEAFVLCDTNSFTFSFDTLFSSGTQPNCFIFPANQDIWFEITISESGTMAWKVTPSNSAELDFAIYDVCPIVGDTSQPIICNYNHQGNNQVPIGLDSSACDTCSNQGCYCAEFSLPINVNEGEIYYIMIDHYSINPLDALFTWTGTAGIGCTTNINQIELDHDDLFYPNPSNSILNEKDFKYGSIHDLFGKEVLRFENEKFVDISELPKGNYVVSIYTGTDLIRQKLIKY